MRHSGIWRIADVFNPDIGRVMFMHTALISTYGGSRGVRDIDSLEAAIARPRGASFGQEHFPSPFDKAAAITESIIKRHPLVDGNKRTGVTAGAYLLSTYGRGVVSTQKRLEDFAVGIANDEMSTEDIARWFKDNSRPKPGA